MSMSLQCTGGTGLTEVKAGTALPPGISQLPTALTELQLVGHILKLFLWFTKQYGHFFTRLGPLLPANWFLLPHISRRADLQTSGTDCKCACGNPKLQ